MVSLRTLALSCSAALMTPLTAPLSWAQEVDVQAGDTAVQVDRNGVEAEARGDAQVRQRDRQLNRADANMDRQIAQWLIVDQQSIVSLAQYGMQRTQTPQVRELAEMIARDHQALAEKLGEVSSRDAGLRNTDPANPRSADAPRNEQREAAREARRDATQAQDTDRRRLDNLGERLEDGVEQLADRAERVVDNARVGLDRVVDGERGNGDAGRTRWIAIHREITQKVQDVAQRDLQNRQGYEFDAALVGMLIAAHLQQEATLEVLSSRASEELAPTLQQAQVSVKQHREQAEQVMEQAKR